MNYFGPTGGIAGGLVGVGQSQAAVCPAPSPLAQRFAELEDLAKQFHAIAHGFDNKLNTVLNPQMANGVGAEKAAPKPIVAPLTERLDSLIAEMRAATVRLNDIQDRIAL
jgi:hypothetical protein